MKRNIKITKLAVFMLTLIVMLAVSAVGMAKGGEEWKKAEGNYTWKESSQYNNGHLIIKPMEEGLFLFEFDVMRGSEAEDSSYDFSTAGILLVNDNGVGEAEFDVDKKPVKLTFTLKDKTITVKQEGSMPADVSGAYEFMEKGFDVSEAAAMAVLEGISPVKTSLNSANRPYRLVYAHEAVGGWFYDIRAIHQPDNKLTTKKAPLLPEEEEEEVPVPEGATEEKTDGKDADTKDNLYTISAVVNVEPADPAIKVGESSKLRVTIPGNLKYKLSDLKSSADDKVSVAGDGTLAAKAEGVATISGKITVDNASRDFKVEVTAYVPKLECDALPSHIDVNEKLELSSYITGQEGEVKPQWSVSDSKIAEIKDGVLVGKADGLADLEGCRRQGRTAKKR